MPRHIDSGIENYFLKIFNNKEREKDFVSPTPLLFLMTGLTQEITVSLTSTFLPSSPVLPFFRNSWNFLHFS